MKLEKIKTGKKTKLPAGRNLAKKIISVVLSILVFFGAYFIISKEARATRETVEVVRIRATDGLPKDTVLTEENLEKYQIIEKEHTKDMLLYDEIEDALQKYTANYLRNGAILHRDEYTEEKPQKNPWIYLENNEQLDDKEVLTIPFNYLESGGDILTPGDKVKIRVRCETEVEDTIEEIDMFGESHYSTRTRTLEINEILFDRITVTDMLNSKSRSIFEVYQEVLRYPESERQRLLKSSEFMNNIVPKSLVILATREEVEKYMEYKNKNKDILITILPRDNNSIILDFQPALEAEVQKWLDGQKK